MNFQDCTLLLLLTFFLSCQQKGEDSSKGTATAGLSTGNVPIVEVVNPEKRTFEANVVITGNLEAEQMVKLYAMEGGFVQTIHKDIGDKVEQGQTIAELSNPELIQQMRLAEAELMQAKGDSIKAAASYASSQADSKYKKKKYDRLSRVYGDTPDLVTVDDMDKSEADWKVAKASSEKAAADLSNAGSAIQSAQAVVNALKIRVGMLNVRAPFTGYITKRYVDKGAMVTNALKNSNATPIVDLVDVSKLRLIVEYPESDLALIEKGTSVSVTFPEAPGKKYSASINRIAAALNPQSKTVRAEIDIEDNNGDLKPGMYGKVATQQKSRRTSLAVPTQAITAVKNQAFIFIIKNGVAKKIPVRLGLEDKFFIEVMSDELTEADKVVVQGKGLINDGTEVIAKDKVE